MGPLYYFNIFLYVDIYAFIYYHCLFNHTFEKKKKMKAPKNLAMSFSIGGEDVKITFIYSNRFKFLLEKKIFFYL